MKVPATIKTHIDGKDRKKPGDNDMNKLSAREYYNMPQSSTWTGNERNIPPGTPDINWVEIRGNIEENKRK